MKEFSRQSLSDELKTNIIIIDYQHNLLVNLFEKAEKQKICNKNFYRILSETNNYLRSHFQTEEKFMHYIHYANVDMHKKDHSRLIEEYDKLLSEGIRSLDFITMSKQLRDFLLEWNHSHYMYDKELIKYFKLSGK